MSSADSIPTQPAVANAFFYTNNEVKENAESDCGPANENDNKDVLKNDVTFQKYIFDQKNKTTAHNIFISLLGILFLCSFAATCIFKVGIMLIPALVFIILLGLINVCLI